MNAIARVRWWGAVVGLPFSNAIKKLVTFSTLIWIGSRVCLPLLDTGSYTGYTLIKSKTQKLVYAIWGLCRNNFELSSLIFPSKFPKVWGESDQGFEAFGWNRKKKNVYVVYAVLMLGIDSLQSAV